MEGATGKPGGSFFFVLYLLIIFLSRLIEQVIAEDIHNQFVLLT